MSRISDPIALTLSALAGHSSQALEYRVGVSGSWTALTGGFLTYGEPGVLGFDENGKAIIAPSTAKLKLPKGHAVILAVGTLDEPGDFVREGADTAWAVVGSSRTFAQTIYELVRDQVVEITGDARGKV